MGETEQETLSNVTFAKWDFNADEFHNISKEGKEFISKLLVKDPRYVTLYYVQILDIRILVQIIHLKFNS